MHRYSKPALIFLLLLLLPLTTWLGAGSRGVPSPGRLQAPDDLRVNLLRQALGVSGDSLSFSWANRNRSSGSGTQTGYQILIASSEEKLNGDVGDVADTGKVRSPLSSGVRISKLVLPDDGLYYWKVRVWDGSGQVTPYASAQTIVTKTAWPAGTASVWVPSASPAQTGKFAFFRAEFSVSRSSVKKAVLSVTASSPDSSRMYVYHCYLNGGFVGLGPAQSANGQLQFNTYDVTNLLRQGRNAVGALCYAPSGRQFLLQLTVFDQSGRHTVVLSSSRDRTQFQALDGTDVFRENDGGAGTDYYEQANENLDARFYPEGWSEPGFQGKNWTTPKSAGSFRPGTLTPAEVENEQLWAVKPQSVQSLGGGRYLLDFGQELIGCLQLSGDSPTAATVELRYGEQKNADGSVKYQTSSGNSFQEFWTLKAGRQQLQNFLMRPFRYVEVSGCPFAPTSDHFRAEAVRQSFDDTESDFSSSDADLNRLYAFSKYTIKATSQNLYVDSQLRERGVYEGDTLINMLASFAVQKEWALPRASVSFLLGRGTWPADYQLLTPTLCWEEYLQDGDKSELKAAYGTLQKTKLFENELNPVFHLLQTQAFQGANATMVDWPATERDGYQMDAEYNTVLNAIAARSYQDMARIASALGKRVDALHYRSQAETIRGAMMKWLYDPQKGLFRDGLSADGQPIEHWAQHASAFALACGVVDSGQIAGKLAANLGSVPKGSPYEAFFLLEGLYRADAGTQAVQVMTNTTTRGWLHMLDGLGATITAEAWDPSIKSNMTLCHPWGAAPTAEIVRGLFGIQPLKPGYALFQVKLQPGGVQRASVRVPTVKGTVSVSYRQQGGALIVSVTVPANTNAEVSIPISSRPSGSLTVDGSSTGNGVRKGAYQEVRLTPGQHQLVWS